MVPLATRDSRSPIGSITPNQQLTSFEAASRSVSASAESMPKLPVRSVARLHEACLERLEKGYQIRLFLVGESDLEALVIEVHDVFEAGCRAVMKIGSPRSEPM
jgi:hypothetical protein